MSRSKSKYAEKRDRGEQMFGPGCCAHKLTDTQVQSAKERARARGHFDPPKPRLPLPDEYYS